MLPSRPYFIIDQTIAYYTIQYFSILYYIILYYTILYYIKLYYIILYDSVLYYAKLYYTISTRQGTRATAAASDVAASRSAKVRRSMAHSPGLWGNSGNGRYSRYSMVYYTNCIV